MLGAYLEPLPDADLDGFTRFARGMHAARDIDPLYPVLAHLFAVVDEPGEAPDDADKQVWAVLVYVAFYNLPSALTYLDETSWQPGALLPAATARSLPTGIERRGLRGGVVIHHLEDLSRKAYAAGGFASWLAPTMSIPPPLRWYEARQRLERVAFNGRWASYKTAEVLQKALRWPLEPPDMGMDGATGPLAGLRTLFPEPRTSPGGGYSRVDVAEAQGRALLDHLQRAGVPVDIAEVETLLCDWHSLVEGRYYVGHDTALLWQNALAAPASIARRVHDAMGHSFPDAALEAAGAGVQADRKQHYARNRVVWLPPGLSVEAPA